MSLGVVRTIAVDLDGTLIRSDLLVEGIFLFLRKHPLRFWQLPIWLLQGKAYLKQRIADAVAPHVETLPYNERLLEWLREQRSGVAYLVLATASDLRLAQRVAQHVAIFDEVFGTEHSNLSSKNKRDLLVARFGSGGFEYVGNAQADCAVWESACLTHVVNPERGVLAEATKLGKMGQVFEDRASYLRVLAQALRLHQWAKNLLVLVPLLAAHRATDLQLLSKGIIAFLFFGACASSVYLLNDLLDLQDDRRHRTKRFRPLAAGAFPIFHAMVWMPALLLVALVAALWLLPPAFALVLLIYCLLTLAYSIGLKRVVMLDVVTLAATRDFKRTFYR